MQKFIKKTEEAGELVRIKVYVDPVLEMSETVDRISKEKGGGKAVLFENTGTDFPVLMNALGSENRMQIALGVNDFGEIGKEIETLFKNLTGPKKNIVDKLKLLPELAALSSYMPKQISGKGKSQEVIHQDPDLSILPILKTWSRDGGRFITLPQVITKDPDTGIRNVGMYRMQIFEKNLTGMHWHKHKTGARHFNEYKRLGKKMPVSVALGGDPVLTYAATAPLPDNIDEYMLAGFLRKQKVKLVKAITQDIEVPAEADIIIEGYVDPQEDFIWEGPFGDHTGFFSLADWYPKFHVTCITHRKDAVYPATVVGIPPMEDAYIAKATERIFLAPIKLTMLPEMANMNIPDAGVAHNLTLVSIQKTFAGQAQKAMSSLWGAGQMMFNKMLTVFDSEVMIDNYESAARIFSEHVDPEHDIVFIKGPLDVLDHSSSKFAFGSKMGIDATKKFKEEMSNEHSLKPDIKAVNINVQKLKEKYSEIKEINTTLLKKDISFIFISIIKTKKQHIKLLSEQLVKEQGINKVKFLVFVDYPVDVFDIEQTTWIFANNIEPLRDCFIYGFKNEDEVSHLAIDGTRKRADIDNFKRDWPDIVTSDEETIKLVDNRWDEYGIGKFIKSPSEKYKPLILSNTAIVE
ncbi:MAG: menaquinone biosynthesis decarboxylase [Bacteroidales bacterium]|nr:menaquinone biosynthesis decarboxylase [Bacteroidales bacterium]